jgi:hypothetical protein
MVIKEGATTFDLIDHVNIIPIIPQDKVRQKGLREYVLSSVKGVPPVCYVVADMPIEPLNETSFRYIIPVRTRPIREWQTANSCDGAGDVAMVQHTPRRTWNSRTVIAENTVSALFYSRTQCFLTVVLGDL